MYTGASTVYFLKSTRGEKLDDGRQRASGSLPESVEKKIDYAKFPSNVYLSTSFQMHHESRTDIAWGCLDIRRNRTESSDIERAIFRTDRGENRGTYISTILTIFTSKISREEDKLRFSKITFCQPGDTEKALFIFYERNKIFLWYYKGHN